jgi:hypothetical protein
MKLLPRWLFVALVLPIGAFADTITWNLSGTVSFVDFNLAPQFSVGQAFTGAVTFETATPGEPYPGSPELTRYQGAVTSFTYTIGSYSGTVAANHQVDVLVGTGITFNTNGDENDPVAAAVSGFTPRNIAAQFGGYGASSLADVLTIGNPSSANSFFRMDFSLPNGGQIVALTADRISATSSNIVTQPTPPASSVPDGGSTLLLLGIGLAVTARLCSASRR